MERSGNVEPLTIGVSMRLQRKLFTLVFFTGLTAHSWGASTSSEVGTIRLGEDLTVTVRRSIGGTDTPVTLSPGQYDLDRWIIGRKDADGVPWTCEGFVPEESSRVDVVAGGEITLPLGEPVLSVLTASRRESRVMFNHRLRGRLGERVEIERNGGRPPAPVLKITNADGSYDKSLTFEYG